MLSAYASGCSAHRRSGHNGASSPELIQPRPDSVSTSTQLPERLISFNCASLGAVPITRPFLPGSERIFAGPRFTTMMTSVFGAAAGLSGSATGWSRIAGCAAAGACAVVPGWLPDAAGALAGAPFVLAGALFVAVCAGGAGGAFGVSAVAAGGEGEAAGGWDGVAAGGGDCGWGGVADATGPLFSGVRDGVTAGAFSADCFALGAAGPDGPARLPAK